MLFIMSGLGEVLSPVTVSREALELAAFHSLPQPKSRVLSGVVLLVNTRKTELPSAEVTRVFLASLVVRTAPFALAGIVMILTQTPAGNGSRRARKLRLQDVMELR